MISTSVSRRTVLIIVIVVIIVLIGLASVIFFPVSKADEPYITDFATANIGDLVSVRFQVNGDENTLHEINVSVSGIGFSETRTFKPGIEYYTLTVRSSYWHELWIKISDNNGQAVWEEVHLFQSDFPDTLIYIPLIISSPE